MMKLFIILTIITLSTTEILAECPDTILFNGIYHEKEVLKSNLPKARNFAIDYDKNVLFFTFAAELLRDDIENSYTSAFLDLKTKEFDMVTNIQNGYANAVDAKNNIVYLGSPFGISTFDYKTKTAKDYLNDVGIWQLFFKEKLYFTDDLFQTAYFVENGIAKKLPELEGIKIEQLALDKEDNIIFSNTSGLFCYKKDKATIIKIGEHIAEGFTTNKVEDVIFFTNDGVYTINKEFKVVKVATMPYIDGLVIAEDGSIIYSDKSKRIMRLKPTNKTCDFENNN